MIAPLVIDTPNQQEQSLSNYDKIVEILTQDLPYNSQVIVCAMKNEQLKPNESITNVIELDERKILINKK